MTMLTLPAAKVWHSGWDEPRGHKGQDFGWGAGDQVLAAAPGVVVEVYGGGGYNGGWGNRVVISHGGKNYTTYNHLATGTIGVGAGDLVARGQHIATMGSTGLSTAKHLHFELELGGRGAGYRTDPEPYYTADLPGTGTDPGTPEEEAETMKYAFRYTKSSIDHVKVFHPESGWEFDYTTRDTKFNNLMMKTFGFTEIVNVDESIYDAIGRSLSAVRQGK